MKKQIYKADVVEILKRYFGISWTNCTWNPVRGCSICSPGCIHCYAMMIAARFSNGAFNGFAFMKDKLPHWTGEVSLIETKLNEPLHWKEPGLIFVNSMSDLFHEKLPLDDIQKVFDVMRRCPQHQFQILTKRAERLASVAGKIDWPSNVWMGVSVESPDYFSRIDYLRNLSKLRGPAVKFLSVEPLIAAVPDINLSDIDWVIVGGESGRDFRAMNEDWVREMRDACEDYGVPFFYKQASGYNPPENPMLDGKVHHDFPTLVRAQIVCNKDSWTGQTKKNDRPLSTGNLIQITTLAPAAPELIQIAPKVDSGQTENSPLSAEPPKAQEPANKHMRYQQERKVMKCMNCGDPREIIAFGLCARCYKAHQREKEKAEDTANANAGGRKERKRLLKAYSAITMNLLELGVRSDDVTAIKHILAPYLETIQIVTGLAGTDGASTDAEEEDDEAIRPN